MHYNFIEIGTSDFRTIVENVTTETGICIEPIPLYLENLPMKPNVKKVLCAISDEDSEGYIFFVHPDDIEKYKLPMWVRGCNSINHPHPTIESMLKENHDKIIMKEKIKLKTWKTLVKENGIGSIGTLKIDTEGHDHVILKGYHDECINNRNLLAEKIIFEYNELGNKNELDKLIKKFKKLGYNGKQTGFDFTMEKI